MMMSKSVDDRSKPLEKSVPGGELLLAFGTCHADPIPVLLGDGERFREVVSSHRSDFDRTAVTAPDDRLVIVRAAKPDDAVEFIDTATGERVGPPSRVAELSSFTKGLGCIAGDERPTSRTWDHGADVSSGDVTRSWRTPRAFTALSAPTEIRGTG